MKVVCISNGEWDRKRDPSQCSFTVGKVYDVTVANKYYYWRPFGKEEEIKIAYYVIKEDDLGHKGYHCVQSLFSELKEQRKEKLNKLDEIQGG